MTDLDEVQRLWTQQDAKLDRVLRLNTGLLEAAALARAQPGFQRLERSQWGATGVWAVMLLGLGGFAADHRAEPILCLSAILAGLYTIWMLSAAVRLAIFVHGMDFAAPVSVLLDQAAALRLRRITQTRVGVLAGTAVWAPFFVVFCKAVFNVEIDSTVWLAANIISGLALVLVWRFVASRFGDRMAKWPAMQRLMDDIAGRTLTEAMRFLAELAAFKADPAI